MNDIQVAQACTKIYEKFRQVSISALRPSGLNDLLYHPIDPDSEAIADLVASIETNGLLEPLVVTQDGYIVSGHRRYAACQKIGLQEVKCEILPIDRDDPRFLTLLREANRQRVKSFDEIIREQFIDVSKDPDIDEILSSRIEAAAGLGMPGIILYGNKTRAAITRNKSLFLNAIINVLNSMNKFWPLSDRQIHYQLLNDPPLIHAKKADSVYRNDRKSYQSLCDLLTRARLEGYVPWKAISDPTRPMVSWNVFTSVEPFIKEQFESFLGGYFRNYQQSQPCHIEIVGEKNTIESTIRPVAMKYCIPYIIGRGFCSLQPRYELVQRFKASGKDKLVLLILSDHDPDGEEIAQSFAKSIRDDFGVNRLLTVKVALIRDQVDELQLPPMMQAKKGSSNYDKFVRLHGYDVYELEAVRPEKLQAFIEEAIKATIDLDLFNAEVEQERQDMAALKEHRRKMLNCIERHDE